MTTLSTEFPDYKKIYDEVCSPEDRKQALAEYEDLLNELFGQLKFQEKLDILRGLGFVIAIDGDKRTPSEIWRTLKRREKVDALQKNGFDIASVDGV